MAQEVKLLGTYQPMHRAACDPELKKHAYMLHELMTKDDLSSRIPFEEFGKDWNKGNKQARADIAAFGFNPVWCIPCGSPKQSFVHSFMAAPNTGDFFFWIETDQYIKLDKRKLYRLMSKDERDPDTLRECITPDLDDKYCEFVIPVEALSGYSLACFVTFSYDMLFTVGRDLMYFLPCGHTRLLPHGQLVNAADFIGPYMRRVVQEIDFARDHTGIYVAPGVPAEGYTKMFGMTRMSFQNTILPAFTDVLIRNDGNGGFDVSNFFSTLPSIRSQTKLMNEMAAWADSDCTDSSFERLYDDISACWCGSMPVLNMWFNGDPRPGRNDPCLCGSGKKFKKCCGKLHGI